MARPMGFEEFVARQGFHTVYLVIPEADGIPVKVGIAANPFDRFSSHQVSNFIPLKLHRFWWVAGRRIALRIETAFKDHHRQQCVRGEWFSVSLAEAEASIEAAIGRLVTWGVSDDEMLELFEQHILRRSDFNPKGFGIDGLRRG